MTPGRELDALIAEKVMGCPPWPKGDGVTDDTASIQYWSHHILPRFSDNIADAWLVVEKMRGTAIYWEFTDCMSDGWRATIWTCQEMMDDKPHTALRPKLPEAICLAALKAVGSTQ